MTNREKMAANPAASTNQPPWYFDQLVEWVGPLSTDDNAQLPDDKLAESIETLAEKLNVLHYKVNGGFLQGDKYLVKITDMTKVREELKAEKLKRETQQVADSGSA